MPETPDPDVTRLYQTGAAAWLKARDTSLFERPWLDAFRAALPGPRVLDLGCGTGRPMAGHLIANGCALTGVDGAPAMIDHASAAFPGHTWLTADMRALPPLVPFDGILAWHSFFHLPPDDQPAMFATFARLTVPGGALMFTSGTERGTATGSFDGRPLYHGSLDTAEYRDLLTGHGFTVLRHTASDPACRGATVWLARRG
ncbi:methyltransferase [Oceanicola sp. 22II-s10i]|uniref:class I SAM-dependent methyltransferase n=1 Tax=Oceanicola sp. 22II-s10i TaxID=1317116 RepID=UPI000B51E6B1|nr:class I SAM-dependent methyltransferase [Oceanicola sp. 22II-s10i]OWU85735.1 methyltransferase [Oceanicola sp. 22II-s10i]